MRVAAEVVMPVLMRDTVSVGMRVDMLFPAVDIAKADKHVHQSEGYQQPGCNIPPESFEEFQF